MNGMIGTATQFIGLLFQWILHELGARSVNFQGSFGYRTIIGDNPHTVSFGGETPYWGKQIQQIDSHHAHFGIPLVAALDMEWE